MPYFRHRAVRSHIERVNVPLHIPPYIGVATKSFFF